jgi:hypothetical protein
MRRSIVFVVGGEVFPTKNALTEHVRSMSGTLYAACEHGDAKLGANPWPWETYDPAVQQAWSAVTVPANLPALEARLRQELNWEARRFTVRAIQECRRARARA